MSVVTTIMLSVGYENEEHCIADLNDLLLGAEQQTLNDLTQIGLGGSGSFWGGVKFPQMCVWAGAFNHMDVEGFIRMVASHGWRDRQEVQLFLNREHERTFAVWAFDEVGTLRELIPALPD